jgi:hypothetical protein
MKKLLLVACVSIATDLYAQDFQPDLQKLIAKSPYVTMKQDTVKQLPQLPQLLALGKKAAPGVYALPQDGMPCIVPDTNSIAAMPNAAKASTVPLANQMPNAAPKQRLLPPAKEWSK